MTDEREPVVIDDPSVAGNEPGMSISTSLIERFPVEDVSWALSRLEFFQTMPNESRSQKRKVEAFTRQVARELLARPALIEPSLTLWRDTAMAEPGEDQSLFETVTFGMNELLSYRWEDIKPETLAEFTRLYSQRDEIGYIGEAGGKFLQSFFTGPEGMAQRVRAVYKFTLGSLDLVSDRRAVRQAADIHFYFSPLIAPDSSFAFDFIGASVEVADERVVEDYMTIQKAWNHILPVTGISAIKVQRQIRMIKDLPEFIQFSKNVTDEDIRKLGQSNYVRRADALLSYLRNPNLYMSNEGDLERIKLTWPQNLVIKANELRRKMFEFFGTFFDSAAFIDQQAAKSIRSGGLSKGALLRLQDDDLIFDILASNSSLLEEKDKLLESVKELKKRTDYRQRLTRLKEYMTMDANRATLNGIEIFFTVRDRRPIDDLQHPLATLLDEGFPLVGIDSRAIDEKITTLLKRIPLERIGRVRKIPGIPIAFEELRNIGFKSLDFETEPKSMGGWKVTIHTQSGDFNIRLDENLVMDPEGLVLPFSTFRNNLQYIILHHFNEALIALPSPDSVKRLGRPKQEQNRIAADEANQYLRSLTEQ